MEIYHLSEGTSGPFAAGKKDIAALDPAQII